MVVRCVLGTTLARFVSALTAFAPPGDNMQLRTLHDVFHMAMDQEQFGRCDITCANRFENYHTEGTKRAYEHTRRQEATFELGLVRRRSRSRQELRELLRGQLHRMLEGISVSERASPPASALSVPSALERFSK